MKLYGFPPSPNTWKVRAVAAHIGLPLALELVDLAKGQQHTPAFRALNPTGRTPVLVDGDFVLQGVAGTGAPIRLSFLEPGGATTGKVLPTGNARDTLTIPGLGEIEVSLVDSANPVVFVDAKSLGLDGTAPGLQALVGGTGLTIDNVDHVVVGLQLDEPNAGKVVRRITVVVRTRAPYDAAAVRKALQAAREPVE